MDEHKQVDISTLPDTRSQKERVKQFIEEARNLPHDKALVFECLTLKEARSTQQRVFYRLTSAGIKQEFTISYLHKDNKILVIVSRK